MKYVGASNSFIRIPFFVEGMFIGIISAVVALILTCVCYNSLFELITSEIKTWNMLGFDGFIPFKSVVLPLGACYLIAGSGIGAIGCMFSTRKHLKV